MIGFFCALAAFHCGGDIGHGPNVHSLCRPLRALPAHKIPPITRRMWVLNSFARRLRSTAEATSVMDRTPTPSVTPCALARKKYAKLLRASVADGGRGFCTPAACPSVIVFWDWPEKSVEMVNCTDECRAVRHWREVFNENSRRRHCLVSWC